MPIRNPRDFWSGVLFTLFGVGTLAIGSKYTLGTAARMGPGYFPRILGILLIVLGVVRIITAFDARAGAQWGWIAFGGLLTLVLGVLIVLHWPATSLFVLGLFLGIDLIYQGIAWILFGIGVRRLA